MRTASLYHLSASRQLIGQIMVIRSTHETRDIVGSLLPRWFVENSFEADLTDGELISAWLQTLCDEAKDQLSANIIPASILMSISKVIVACAELIHAESYWSQNLDFQNHLREFTVEKL